jgi:hypothetical protein
MEESETGIQEVLIDFHDSQVAVRTNMPEVAQFVRESHAPMIVPSGENVVRTLDVMKVGGHYKLGDDMLVASGPPPTLFDLVRQTIQREFVEAHPNVMWMHAGAVANGASAILVVGPSTAGKSTIVTRLIDKGLAFMTDELAGVYSDGTVTGYPRVPTRRTRSDRALTRAELGNVGRETIHVPAGNIRREPAPIRAMVFCQYAHGERAELTRISSGDAAVRLIQSLMRFGGERETHLSLVAGIARTIPAY